MLFCPFAAYNYFTSLDALYWTFTKACAPETGIACIPASRAPPRVMESVDWPPAFAMNVKVITGPNPHRSEEHTSELQSRENLVCRLLLEKKKISNRDPSSSTAHTRCSSFIR